jgi:hypothetical protein
MPQEREEDEALLLWFDDGQRQIECVGAKVRSGAGQGRASPTAEISVKTGSAIVLLAAGVLQRRDCRR